MPFASKVPTRSGTVPVPSGGAAEQIWLGSPTSRSVKNGVPASSGTRPSQPAVTPPSTPASAPASGAPGPASVAPASAAWGTPASVTPPAAGGRPPSPPAPVNALPRVLPPPQAVARSMARRRTLCRIAEPPPVRCACGRGLPTTGRQAGARPCYRFVDAARQVEPQGGVRAGAVPHALVRAVRQRLRRLHGAVRRDQPDHLPAARKRRGRLPGHGRVPGALFGRCACRRSPGGSLAGEAGDDRKRSDPRRHRRSAGPGGRRPPDLAGDGAPRAVLLLLRAGPVGRAADGGPAGRSPRRQRAACAGLLRGAHPLACAGGSAGG